MTTENTHLDLLDIEEYPFHEAVSRFAGENADVYRIKAAEKKLCEAIATGKLKAKLAYLPNKYVEWFNDAVFQSVHDLTSRFPFNIGNSGMQYEGIPSEIRIWAIGQLKKMGFMDESIPTGHEGKEYLFGEGYRTKKAFEEALTNADSKVDWCALTIEYLEHINKYDKELFDKESNKIDFESVKLTGGAIREYRINEGKHHPYFNPEESITNPDAPAATVSEKEIQAKVDKPEEQTEGKTLRKKWDNVFKDFDTTCHNSYDQYLDRLTNQQREAILLKHMHNCNDTEIGKRLGVSRKRAGDILAAADTKLKNNRGKNFTKKQQADEDKENDYMPDTI